MTTRNLLIGSGVAVTVPESVDFDGANDYVSWASDLTGNADGKTFTFSAFVYYDGTNAPRLYHTRQDGSNYFEIYIANSTDSLSVWSVNGGTTIVGGTTGTGTLSRNTWNHILVSIDMSNSANRYIFVNDVDVTSTVGVWTYVNNNLKLANATTGPTVAAARYPSASGQLKGRLAHVFLAYQYVDLSVESNRRIFITAEGTPA